MPEPSTQSGNPIRAQDREPRAVGAVVASVSLSLMLSICGWVYRDDINRILDPQTSLSLDAGPRSFSEDTSEHVRRLLERGADPNQRNEARKGYAPVHEAAHWGNEAALALFADHGADLNQSIVLRGETMSPLDLACRFGDEASIQLLARNDAIRYLEQRVAIDDRSNPVPCYEPGDAVGASASALDSRP